MNIKTNPLKMLFKLSALLVKNTTKARTKPPNAKVIIPLTAFVPKESPNQIYCYCFKKFVS